MGSKALTIDGRPWSYRDPNNDKYNEYVQAGIRGDDGSAEDNWNVHSYAYTNPLYDYSKGSVQDAAKALGIGNVDEKHEVKSILNYIQEGGRKKEEDKPKETVAAPEPTPEPLPPRGSTFKEDRKDFKQTRLQRPGNQAPRMGFTDDASKDAIRHGEDLNAHYVNKFIPSLEAEARLTAQEIGESGRFNLNRFVGKIPELGDPKDMFAFYSKQLTDNA